MKNEWISSKSEQAKSASSAKAASSKRALKKTKLKDDKFAERIVEIQEEIAEGLGKSAEETILHVKESHELDSNQKAKLDSFHSLSLEIRGKNRESFEILEEFVESTRRADLEPEIQLLVSSQLASALVNIDEPEKAKSLADETLEIAKGENKDDFLGTLYLVRARANKKLGEIEDAFRDSDTALDHFRDVADWRGMAWAYYQQGTISLLNGLVKKSLDYFNLAIQMVGENSEPMILGRVFADMAGSHWLQNQAKRSVESLDKALEFFKQTENELQQIFAYNDLGASLTLLGDWLRAEEATKKSLEFAGKLEHPHVAGIYDSLGELKLLQGEYADATGFLKKELRYRKSKMTTGTRFKIYELWHARNLPKRSLTMRSKSPNNRSPKLKRLVLISL